MWVKCKINRSLKAIYELCGPPFQRVWVYYLNCLHIATILCSTRFSCVTSEKRKGEKYGCEIKTDNIFVISLSVTMLQSASNYNMCVYDSGFLLEMRYISDNIKTESHQISTSLGQSLFAEISYSMNGIALAGERSLKPAQWRRCGV